MPTYLRNAITGVLSEPGSQVAPVKLSDQQRDLVKRDGGTSPRHAQGLVRRVPSSPGSCAALLKNPVRALHCVVYERCG